MSSVRIKINQLAGGYTNIASKMQELNTIIKTLTDTAMLTFDDFSERTQKAEETLNSIELDAKKLAGECRLFSQEYSKITPDTATAAAYQSLQLTHQTCFENIRKYRKMILDFWTKLENSLPPPDEAPLPQMECTTPTHESKPCPGQVSRLSFLTQPSAPPKDFSLVRRELSFT